MLKISFATLLICLLVIAAPATAWQGPEILAAHGRVWHHVNVVSSPIPAYCYWETGESVVQEFSATEADGYGNMECPHPWLAHCDSDSMSFSGTWPMIDSFAVSSVDYQVEFTCSVILAEETLLVSRRSVVSNGLTTDEHSITVEYPSGNIFEVLSLNAGPDESQILFSPGLYTLRLHIYSKEYRNSNGVINPYHGHVLMAWTEPGGGIPVESNSWGSLKAMFR